MNETPPVTLGYALKHLTLALIQFAMVIPMTILATLTTGAGCLMTLLILALLFAPLCLILSLF